MPLLTLPLAQLQTYRFLPKVPPSLVVSIDSMAECVGMVQVGKALGELLPNIISKQLGLNAPAAEFDAQMAEIMQALRNGTIATGSQAGTTAAVGREASPSSSPLEATAAAAAATLFPKEDDVEAPPAGATHAAP